MTRIPRYLCGLGFGVGMAIAGACNPGPSQDTSGTSETGDCDGEENCFCLDDSDCNPGLVCASRVCTPDGGGTVSTASSEGGETTTTGTTSEPGTSSGSSGDSTGQAETVGTECDPAQGVVNGECMDPAKPYCDPQGSCVGCTGLESCSEVSDVTPVCDEGTGLCEVCTAEDSSACEGTTPVCNALNKCVACTAHEECPSDACNFVTGACFTTTLYVDQAATCAVGTGTVELPFCEIQDAVSKAAQGQPLVVRVRPSQGAYVKQIQVAPGRVVAIVRDGVGTATLEVPDLDAMVINNGALAFLHNLRITGGANTPAVRCTSSASAWLDRVVIEKRDGYAIDGAECTLTLRRAKLYKNNAGGLKLSGGDTLIENSYLVQNGNSFGAISAITAAASATVDVVYSTIADNDAMGGVGESLHCINPGQVELRNAIVFGQAENTSVTCPTATAKDSVVDAPTLTGTNVIHEPVLDPAWFVAPATGNFAVKGGAPFEGVAVWRVGDPAVDYDGDPRITDDGSPDYTGADRPN